jgi:hypothetical protein
MIEIQNSHGNFTYIRQWIDDHLIEPEMFSPLVNPWIIEPDKFLSPPDYGAYVAALETIAISTGVTCIVSISQAPMLFANDMVYLAAEVGIIFMNQTVFA